MEYLVFEKNKKVLYKKHCPPNRLFVNYVYMTPYIVIEDDDYQTIMLGKTNIERGY